MTRRALVAALAVLACVPVPAGAETRASVARVTADVAHGVGGNHPTKPTVVVRALLARFVAVGANAGVTGASHGSGDQVVVCLEYRAGARAEIGCALLQPGRPATDGALAPEGATIRARVPVSGRRGGWIEADLRLSAGDSPLRTPPAVASHYVHTYGALGYGVPVGGLVSGGPALYRDCEVRGTFRTDRGLKATIANVARPPHPTYVARYELVGASATLDPDDVTARAVAAFSRA